MTIRELGRERTQVGREKVEPYVDRIDLDPAVLTLVLFGTIVRL